MAETPIPKKSKQKRKCKRHSHEENNMWGPIKSTIWLPKKYFTYYFSSVKNRAVN